MFKNEDAVRYTNPPEGYVQREMQKQLLEMERQRKTYLGDRRSVPLEGKMVIVVDDGIATGLKLLTKEKSFKNCEFSNFSGTARVAMKALRQKKVKRAILASPVAPSDTLGKSGDGFFVPFFGIWPV